MVSKKFGVLVLVSLTLLLTLSLVSASLEISEKPISSMAIPDLNKPAIFNITIKNNGADDTFMMSSLAGIYFEPNESFSISQGSTKTLTVKIYPKIPLKVSPDYYSFEYEIKGEDAEQIDDVALTLVRLKEALEVSAEDITVESNVAVLYLENKYGGPLEKLSVDFSSMFFSETREITLAANEKKKIEINVDQDELKKLVASPYMVTLEVTSGSAQAELGTFINFVEKEGITTTQSSEGFMLHRYEIEKKNTGNTQSTVTIIVSKNLFSALFTSFNIMPDKKELSKLHLDYSFTKELAPSESLRVISKTNWWILVLIIIIIGVIWYFLDKYVKNKIVLKKEVFFVRTKGGEFALKVSINVKARDFTERIRIIDRLPPMVKVFDRQGISAPDRIDEANRRLEWNIQALGKGEERTLSYIIYSKIGVVGRFELPSAEAIYEFNGQLKEAQSNRAFYSKGE